MQTPILFFGFVRPEHTLRALSSLAANPESKDARLFVFIDGPRRESDVERIHAVDRVARSMKWCGSVEIVHRKENWGCPRSIITEVSEFTDRFGTAIVLEDDIVLSPYFLRFMDQALTRYRDEPRVFELSGYRYPVTNVAERSGFTHLSIGWGWATWKRAWKHFDPSAAKLLAQIEPHPALVRRFNLDGGFNYLELLRAVVAGKIGGWDIRWYASMLLQDGLTLYPALPLSTNIGWDGSGTNAGVDRRFDTELSDRAIDDLPGEIGETADFRVSLRRYFLDMQGPLPRRIVLGLRRRLKQALAIRPA